MPLAPLSSSTLAGVLYHPQRATLDVAFHSGERYRYFQVPPLCYQQLLDAPSKGQYFNHYIRNCFPCQRLTHLAAPIVLAHSP